MLLSPELVTIGGMKRLLVSVVVAAAVLSLVLLAMWVARPSEARSVPAIELTGPTATTDREPAKAGGSRRPEETTTSKPKEQDRSADRPPAGSGGGATAVVPAPPAPAGDDDDDDGEGDGDDDGDDEGGDD
jgi:hypothetical protein